MESLKIRENSRSNKKINRQNDLNRIFIVIMRRKFVPQENGG